KSLFKESTLRVSIPLLPETILHELQQLVVREQSKWDVIDLQGGGVQLVFRSEDDLTSSVLAVLSRYQSPVLSLSTEQPSLEDVILLMADRRSA
ncbi:hypothetical protein MXD63_42205, partial [Frankia sp. Cpl3]|nr:hypothetical protein [Frankia sp. Cpl3]